MKRTILIIFSLFFFMLAHSQRSYFIYIQSASGVPFYVKLNNAVHSSATSGYLILAKLQDSTYTFKLGFPQEFYPEQQFTIEMGGQDHGLLLKKFGENDWGLFDLQSLNITKAAGSAKPIDVAKTNNNSSFGEILSQATNDPTLIEKPAAEAKKEEPKPKEEPIVVVEEKKPIEKRQTAQQEVPSKPIAETKAEPEVAESDKDPVVTPADGKMPPVVLEEMAPLAKSTIKRRSESSTTAGFGLIFLDSYENGVTDTISILIPHAKAVVLEEQPEKKQEEKKFLDVGDEKKPDSGLIQPQFSEPVVTKDESPSVVKEPVIEAIYDTVQVPDKKRDVKKLAKEKKQAVEKESQPVVKQQVMEVIYDTAYLPTSQKAVKDSEKKASKKKKQGEEEQPILSEPKIIAENPACTSIATDNDFLALRKKMVAEENDDNMIDVAKKALKAKCYTTQQVKNLSVLLLNDAAKYEFFDIAYKYVADPSKFSSLAAELKDDYYIKRFQAMLK